MIIWRLSNENDVSPGEIDFQPINTNLLQWISLWSYEPGVNDGESYFHFKIAKYTAESLISDW